MNKKKDFEGITQIDPKVRVKLPGDNVKNLKTWDDIDQMFGSTEKVFNIGITSFKAINEINIGWGNSDVKKKCSR